MTVIDKYLQKLEPEKREQLERIRSLAKQMVPEATEAIMYNMPTLKYLGKPFLGFNVHKNHIGIYPFSGEVVEKLKDRLTPYSFTKGAIQIPYDSPIPEKMLREIIDCKLEMIKI